VHSLIEEYRTSLKMPEAEELGDLLFYRPLGFLFVKAVQRSPLRPNHVTALSLVFGLLAAWDFSAGRASAAAVGGAWYALANVFDCADGQLARLQKSGTLLGRVVDGAAAYISSVAIFLALGLGWARGDASLWGLVIAAGFSSALQAMFFDHYQSEYISAVRAEKNFLDREMEQFSAELRRLRETGKSALARGVLEIYIWYMRLQKRSSTREELRTYEPEFYKEHNTGIIRMWSFLGPTTNRTALIACVLFGNIHVYLWIVVVPVNIWLFVCYALQRRIHKAMEASWQ
jgi:phosphatidylglycerophosphate synthase